MISTKLNFHLLINILLISGFSSIHTSEPKKPEFFNGIRITNNNKPSESQPPSAHITSKALPATITQPSTVDESLIAPKLTEPSQPASNSGKKPAAKKSKIIDPAEEPLTPEQQEKRDSEAKKIDDYLADRNKFDFVDKPESTAQPVLQETTITVMPASNKLGDPFIPSALPEQISTIRLSRQGWTETNLAYILRLIENGQFTQALSDESKIFEILGQALKDSAIAFSNKQKDQQVQNRTTLEQQRPDFQATTNAIDLIANASAECCQPGSIVPVRIKEILDLLEQEQRKMEEVDNAIVQELTHRETRLKGLRKRVLLLHATADKLRAISPSRQLNIVQPK